MKLPKKLTIAQLRCILIVFSLFGAGTGKQLLAQNETPTQQSSSTSAVSGQARQTRPQMESGSSLGSIFFSSNNSLILSLAVDGTAQNNLLYQEQGEGVYETSLHPTARLAYQRQYARGSIGLDYAYGHVFYQSYQSYNQDTHDGGVSLRYRFSPRLDIEVGDRASVNPQTGSFWGNDLVTGAANGSGVNNSVFVRTNDAWNNSTYLRMGYLTSRRSQFNFNANYGLLRYAEAGLQNSNSYGGGFGYSYQFSARTGLLLNYNFSYFDVSSGAAAWDASSEITPANRAISHSFTVGLSRVFSPSLSGSISAGAVYLLGDSDYLASGGRYRPGVRPTVNGSITFSPRSFLDQRTFLTIGVSQRMSDGSGLGAVSNELATYASVGRMMARKINLSVTGGYSWNRYPLNLDANGREETINSLYVTPTFRIDITRRFELHGNCSWYRQLSTGFGENIPGRMPGYVATVGVAYSIPKFF